MPIFPAARPASKGGRRTHRPPPWIRAWRRLHPTLTENEAGDSSSGSDLCRASATAWRGRVRRCIPQVTLCLHHDAHNAHCKYTWRDAEICGIQPWPA